MDMIWRAAIASVGLVVIFPMLIAWPMHYKHQQSYLRSWALGSSTFAVVVTAAWALVLTEIWVLG